MADTSIFVECRDAHEVTCGRTGPLIRQPERDRGVGVTRRTGDGLRHEWFIPSPRDTRLEELPAVLRPQAVSLLEAPLPSAEVGQRLAEAAQVLALAAERRGAQRLEVLAHQVEQRVLCWTDGRLSEDLRCYVLTELRVHLERPGTAPVSLWRSVSHRDVSQLESHLGEVKALVGEMVDTLGAHTPEVACPSGELPVVIAPGAASSFFHEICGHPMEGDVVARRASYLAQRLGQQVAAEFVTVLDGPAEQGGVPFSVDDEGTPGRPAALIAGGRVGEPMLDRQVAERLGGQSNGHGRRVSFRHPALPRMSHTELQPHQGTLEDIVADIGEGLLLQHITPRHVDMLSGDYSFFIMEGRQIRDGRLGAFVRPGLLRGNGLESLRRIERVGSDSRNFFSTRGCRKLDHGPLRVSFGQPTLRLRALRVDPWT
jgi:TldD protein